MILLLLALLFFLPLAVLCEHNRNPAQIGQTIPQIEIVTQLVLFFEHYFHGCASLKMVLCDLRFKI
jgi:hypothetical protein